MRGPGFLLGAAMLCGAAHAQQQPSEAFAGLAGYCWRAELADGASDTHCFSMAIGGKLVMDIHKVRNRSGAVVYEGVTSYRAEKETGVVRYDYYNSLGDLLVGYAKRDGDSIRFAGKPDRAGDIVWYLETDAYEVGTAAVTEAKRKFVKAGPVAEGGF